MTVPKRIALQDTRPVRSASELGGSPCDNLPVGEAPAASLARTSRRQGGPAERARTHGEVA